MKAPDEEDAVLCTATADRPDAVTHSATPIQAEPDDSRPVSTSPVIEMIPAGRLGSWHLPRGETLASFCVAMSQRGIDYAILSPRGVRCEGEQVPVLVADADIPRMKDLITRVPMGQQLAVYSTTGLPNFSFQQHWRHNSDATNMAVLPPYLAEDLLKRAASDDQGVRRPSSRDMLLWIIYRALYLGGDENFALLHDEENGPLLIGPMAEVITDLAGDADAELPAPLTLQSLDHYLSQFEWEPPLEVLRRLSCWNSFAATKLAALDDGQSEEEPGMAAFFLRREAVAAGMQDEIAATIEACGFELLKTIDFDERQVEEAARAARGSNWGTGALPVNGGPPVRMIVAFDVCPTPVSEDVRIRYPFLDNERILSAKLMCRQFIHDQLPRNGRFNPLHSVDDSGEAWRFIRMFAADDESELRRLIASRKAEFETKFEVVRNLTRKAARAKIELIRYKDSVAVKKTFRENCLRFLERETSFMNAVSPHRPEIQPVLEQGRNYFIMPFVEAQPIRRRYFGRGLPRLMSLGQVRSVVGLLKHLFDNGFDPVDLAPHNMLIDPAGKVTVIDFEFVHRTDGPIKPEQSACLGGITDDFGGEWPTAARWDPRRSKCLTDPYRDRWFPYTGLSRGSFLHDPPALQWAKRLVNYPAYLGSKFVEHGSKWMRVRAKNGLKRRLPALTRMASNALRTRAA